MASEVPSLRDVQYARLQGARHCAKSGLILFGSVISAALFFGVIIVRDEVANRPEGKVAATIFIVSSAVLLLWGMIRNRIGYARLIEGEKPGPMRQIYVICRFHSWLRFGIVCVFFAAPLVLDPMTHWLIKLIFCCLPMLSLLHTIWLHTRAMKLWNQRLGKAIAPQATLLYLVSGLGGTMMTLGLTGDLILTNRNLDPSPLLMLVLAVCFAVIFAAYRWMYGQLAGALQKEVL